MVLRVFPSREALARPRQGLVDVAVLAGAAALLYALVRVSHGIDVPFDPDTAPSRLSTDPAELPYYAARSLLRMFAALVLSVLFTFVYATAAARLPRAEAVLLPALDILQSVPILGFLSITVTGFLALFPGSELGLECASIFAIFTSQAWNMAFAFHRSLVSQPRELDEAARLLRLSKWQRFWRVDVPGGMIPLVWNGMMSFGGGWFFLVASEALTVDGHSYVLPGIGAYVATATADADPGRVLLAVVVMVVGRRGERAVLAAAHGLGGAVPDRRLRARRGTPQRGAGPAAPLPRPASGRPGRGAAGRATRPGHGRVRPRRAPAAGVGRAPAGR